MCLRCRATMFSSTMSHFCSSLHRLILKWSLQTGRTRRPELDTARGQLQPLGRVCFAHFCYFRQLLARMQLSAYESGTHVINSEEGAMLVSLKKHGGAPLPYSQ